MLSKGVRLAKPVFRHALNDGDPFQINVFFGRVDGKDFYDSRSKNFVGSVFNFSTSTKLSKCGNCTEQQEDDTWSVSQIPATLAVYNYREEHKGNPTPQYVVVNSLGKVSPLGLTPSIRDPSAQCLQ